MLFLSVRSSEKPLHAKVREPVHAPNARPTVWDVRTVYSSVVMVTLGYCVVFLLPGRDVEDISRVLADVPDWKGLAGSLNIRRNDIETNCAQDVAQVSCCRRELVRRCCDSQLSENPSKVAEDIAEALEQMNHKRQAQQLRKLEFGKSMTLKRSSSVG